MNYTEFLRQLQGTRRHLFSTQDLLLMNRKAGVKTLQNQLSQWVKRGYILRLKRDLYELLERGSETKTPVPDLVVANRLLEPSYVSCETALSMFGAIPEVALHMTSVTTKTSRVFRNVHGSFFYHSCQPKMFEGFHLMREGDYSVKMATPEKALVDYVYFKGREMDQWNFEEERLDPEFLGRLDWSKVRHWGRAYSKRCQRDIRELGRWYRAHP